MLGQSCSALSTPGQEWPEDDDSSPESGSEEDSDEAEEAEDTSENPPSAEKRAHHNLLERKRRNEINANYKILQDKIPALVGDTASRSRILTETRKYVQSMRELVAHNDTKLEKTRTMNVDLEQEVRALEKTYRSLRSKRVAKERAQARSVAASRGAAEGRSMADKLYRHSTIRATRIARPGQAVSLPAYGRSGALFPAMRPVHRPQSSPSHFRDARRI